LTASRMSSQERYLYLAKELVCDLGCLQLGLNGNKFLVKRGRWCGRCRTWERGSWLDGGNHCQTEEDAADAGKNEPRAKHRKPEQMNIVAKSR